MKPFILDYVVPRAQVGQQPKIPYYYESSLALNVVSINKRTVPFIEINRPDSELMTKTKAQERESDDDHFSLLELETKSLVPRERDDSDDTNMELYTKTLTKGKADVRGMDLLELTTKTRVRRERDDEHFIDN